MLLANGDGYEPSSRHAVLLALLPWSAWGWIHLTAAAAVLALTILRLGTPALAVGLLAGVAATWSIGLTVGAFASRSLTAAPTAVVWLTLTALVVVVAGWPDPSTAREGDRSDDDPPP
ncbi:hypothetical protein [Aquisalimonas sp.]|uniref:hypothetical protein n=1 Tax=Aquisalimonas sp. TaxID=1872621 RepID=UPI0025BDA391|nr:hypothetical protein [Aquisalimonas sp.]